MGRPLLRVGPAAAPLPLASAGAAYGVLEGADLSAPAPPAPVPQGGRLYAYSDQCSSPQLFAEATLALSHGPPGGHLAFASGSALAGPGQPPPGG